MNEMQKRLPFMSHAVQQIVTFASEPFRGNPAFVITLDSPCSTALLQNVCAQLREGVLAVLSVDGDDVDLSFVTPTGIHPGAGHATHAAAFVALSKLRPCRSIDLRTGNGERRAVWIEDDMISVIWPTMAYSDVDRIQEVSVCFGRAPLKTFNSGFGLIAIYKDAREIAGLRPDFSKISQLSNDTVIVSAPASEADFAIRVFAPKLNLPEDPVCGTAHRIMVPFWAKQFGRKRLVSHQLSDRGGELYCRLENDAVVIAGRASVFLDGTISVPE